MVVVAAHLFVNSQSLVYSLRWAREDETAASLTIVVINSSTHLIIVVTVFYHQWGHGIRRCVYGVAAGGVWNWQLKQKVTARFDHDEVEGTVGLGDSGRHELFNQVHFSPYLGVAQPADYVDHHALEAVSINEELLWGDAVALPELLYFLGNALRAR